MRKPLLLPSDGPVTGKHGINYLLKTEPVWISINRFHLHSYSVAHLEMLPPLLRRIQHDSDVVARYQVALWKESETQIECHATEEIFFMSIRRQ
ncbi:hypothetical protein NPIL_376611 [Nephila pilipes]|uniref:Uncharacterized protein n=1 Tax=Nephila pilipes TaxID=299642 RepID=A0A8X6PY53_NEPPI|nr:hypothetical protein NPIL_376611 [Nephila pilipes]